MSNFLFISEFSFESSFCGWQGGTLGQVHTFSLSLASAECLQSASDGVCLTDLCPVWVICESVRGGLTAAGENVMFSVQCWPDCAGVRTVSPTQCNKDSSPRHTCGTAHSRLLLGESVQLSAFPVVCIGVTTVLCLCRVSSSGHSSHSPACGVGLTSPMDDQPSWNQTSSDISSSRNCHEHDLYVYLYTSPTSKRQKYSVWDSTVLSVILSSLMAWHVTVIDNWLR